MGYDGFSYDFTGKELAYFLFNGKKCPKCGVKMERSKEYEIVDGASLNSKAEAFFVPNAKIKKYVYTYTCQVCKTKYSLKELAKTDHNRTE